MNLCLFLKKPLLLLLICWTVCNCFLSSSFTETGSWSGRRRLSTWNPEGEEVVRRTDAPSVRHRVQMKTEILTQPCVNMHTWPRKKKAAVKTDWYWAALSEALWSSTPAVYLMHCTTSCTIWTPRSGLTTRDSHEYPKCNLAHPKAKHKSIMHKGNTLGTSMVSTSLDKMIFYKHSFYPM